MNLEIRKPELAQRVRAQIQSGHFQDADDLLEKALNNREQTPAFARRDIDFDFIRGEERFKMLVGE